MSGEDPYHTELGFQLEGNFKVSERLGRPSDHETLKLVESSDQVLVVEFGYSEDEDFTEESGFYIGLNCHHVENEETGRVFHAHLRVYPDRTQVKRIRDYCDYLLTLPVEDKA
jgi:hypothetical protein